MSATTWFIIAIVGFSLSAVALIVAVFMFIKMNIPAIIGDLSGKTVAREIKAIRDANASSGEKLHKPSNVNRARGKLTEKASSKEISKSSDTGNTSASKQSNTANSYVQNAVRTSGESESNPNKTESLSTNVSEVDISARLRATEILESERQTEVLSENTNQTAILSDDNQTAVLSSNNQTALLEDSEVANATSVLGEAQELPIETAKPVEFKLTKNIVLINSDEVIK